MSFNFKYALEEKVFTLKRGNTTLFNECLSCTEGQVSLKNGRTLECPICKGKGLIAKWGTDTHVVNRTPLTIGQQRVEIQKEKITEEYMCVEEGVGSGTVFKATDLFTSIKDAHDEADRRNKDVTKYICKKCNEAELAASKLPMGYADSEWLNCPIHDNTSHIRISIKD